MMPGPRHNAWQRLRRLLRLRLVIPVLRSPAAADYTARGVFVGLLVAMTPTVGFQMAIVAGIWAVVRVVRPAWDFNVVVGMLWTWLTNVFTVPPIYYMFLITGEGMLGRWGEAGGYAMFSERLVGLLQTDASFLDSMWIYAVGIFEAWGAPMLVGCVPWAIGSAFLGYWWSLRLVRRFRQRRRRH
ncbi:MAG: DUF2062 domain-containing protein [Alphaproteobacteria bacterium]|jgi:hypothetical protein|nr:DUF2062 domain-containing protein [Alphaproteobacteria bacterium]MDP6873956.1 DUF2062 domain-containing protein [Alphaproteobacteria bacterium]